MLRDLVRGRVETERCGNRHVARVLGVDVAWIGACGMKPRRKEDAQAGGALEQSAERPSIRQLSAAAPLEAPHRAKAKSGGEMANASSRSSWWRPR